MDILNILVEYYSDQLYTNIMYDPLNALLVAVAIGLAMCAALILSFVSRRRAAALVDPLLKMNAVDDATALFPRECGPSFERCVGMLSPGKMMTKTILSAAADDGQEPQTDGHTKPSGNKNRVPKSLLLARRYYIPDGKREEAYKRFSADGAKTGSFVVSLILVVLISIAVILFMPQILHIADNIISIIIG